MAVYPTCEGAFIKVQGVNFGPKGAATFTASVSNDTKPGMGQGSVIELRLDNLQGKLIGTLPVDSTAGPWQNRTVAVTGAIGLHDLYLVFKGKNSQTKLDYWQFGRIAAAAGPLAK